MVATTAAPLERAAVGPRFGKDLRDHAARVRGGSLPLSTPPSPSPPPALRTGR